MSKRIRTVEVMTTLNEKDFKNLSVNLDQVSLKVQAADVDEIHLYYPVPEKDSDLEYFQIQHSVTSGDLTIWEESGTKRRGLFKENINLVGATEVRVFLPRSTKLDLLDIQISMGSSHVEGQRIKDLKADLSMGSLSLIDVEADDITASLSMGSVSLDRAALRQGRMDLSMGSLSGYAAFGGHMDLDLSMGSIDLTLRQEEERLSYDMDTSMGSIKVAGKKLGSTANYKADSETAFVEASVSMGSIGLTFD